MDTSRGGEPDARAAWNAGAEAWQEFVRSGADYYRLLVHGPALLEACLPVEGLRVLDLGCGEGYFSRELARHGAWVVGVDHAEEQLRFAHAREEEEPLGVEYHHLSAELVGDEWESGSFDLVTACMSLQDMRDVDAVLAACGRLLGDGARMVFSVPHPGTDTPLRVWERNEQGEKQALKIDRYFETGQDVLEWKMPRLSYPWATPFWRRTLAEWTRMTADAGFLVRRLYEPRPTEEQVQERPELDDCYRLPYFLIFELVKG